MRYTPLTSGEEEAVKAQRLERTTLVIPTARVKGVMQPQVFCVVTKLSTLGQGRRNEERRGRGRGREKTEEISVVAGPLVYSIPLHKMVGGCALN